MKTKSLVVLLVCMFTASVSAQNPVIDWDAITISTALAPPITAPASNTSGGTGLYLAYAHLAIYNAVNAINHRHKLYRSNLTGPSDASQDAAAVSAAYNTLLAYFPSQSVSLANSYTAALAAIPDGVSKAEGIAVGQAAAAEIVALRSSDGRGASVPYTYPSSPEPGVWIPTPPTFAQPQTPWVGQMMPFTMSSPDQFLPNDGPPPLDSIMWTRDFNETKTLGQSTSAIRTPQQTEIGLFWTEHTARQYGRAFRQLAADHGLSTSDSARLFAMLWTAYADSFIGCMNAKYHFSFWRPVTAIQNADIDGNPDTLADATWMPLAVTPNHPEFPAAHGCVTGAIAGTLQTYFGTPNVLLTVSSTVTNTAHSFNGVSELEDEVFGARIYAGFHYRYSLVEGFKLGHAVVRNMMRHNFRPQSDEEEE
jgi:hypothetical protein